MRANVGVVEEPQDPMRRQIAAARKHAGISQEVLAESLGLTKSTVGRWESGKSPIPSLPYQRRGLIAEILEITGAPPETFNERVEVDRVAALETEVADLKQTLADALFRELEADEEAELRQYLTSEWRSEEQGREAANE